MYRFKWFILIVFVGSPALAEKLAGDAPGISEEKPDTDVFVEVDGRYLVPYTAKIPGTDVTFRCMNRHTLSSTDTIRIRPPSR